MRLLDEHFIVLWLLGVDQGKFLRAVFVLPDVFPALGAPVLRIGGGLWIERLREGDEQAIFCGVKFDWHGHALAGEAHALERAIVAGVGLPAFEAADVKLAVERIKPAAHASAGEAHGQFENRALHHAVHFLGHDVIENRLAIRHAQQMPP